MKSILFKYFFSFLFSAYFLFAGTGFNVINYCCPECEKEGIEAISIEQSSKKINQHFTAKTTSSDCCQHDHITCENTSHQTKGCHLLRVKCDETSLEIKNPLQRIENKFLTIHFLIKNHLEWNCCIVGIARTSNLPWSCSLLSSGRDILCLKSVLII